jgi:hypothetical protein
MNKTDDLIKFLKTDEWEIETPSGWQSFKGLCKYKQKQLYTVTTESRKSIIVSSKHCFIGENYEKILCKNSLNKKIQTKDGLELVVSIIKNKKSFVYDLASVSGGNVFYANGILNHNTHLLEEFWSSVIPTVSSGKKSKILVVSTPNGVDNKFYEIFSAAERNALPPWKAERIDWWEVPGRDGEWKQRMIAALGSEEKFLQEFNNTFLDDSTSAVGALLIERFKQTKKPAIWTSEEGDYSVFEYPDKNKLYVIGVDVGEGIGRAASVAQILDVTNLQDIKQVAVYGSAVIEPYHFANKLLTIGQSWGVPPILIERNNCGAQVIDALHYHHNYEKIVAYSKISTSDKYNTTRNLGVLSHTNIRSDGIANMRYWVNDLQAVQINDPQTISEFETFVKHPNGVYKKRTDKFFDDRIMALTWALFILKTEIAEQYFQIVDFDLQNHPLKIVPNGYWENFTENYDLKDLSKNPSVVPKPAAEENLAYPALGITQKEIETLDKYDLDEDSLLEMGYTYFNQDV